MSTVQDDKPIAVEGASVSISVDEHFHHHGWFHFGFGHFDDTRFTRAELQDLVDAGTDGPALFTLDTSISGPVKTTDGTLATSHGVQIKYAAAGQRIIGFADTDGDGSRDPGEHVVFRLADKGSRGFDFDLRGEVDHPASNGTSGAEVLSLDLTNAFSATDSDGDPVTLAAKSIVAEVGEHEHGPHEHEPHDPGPHEDGPHEHEADENEADEHDPHEDGPDEHGSNGPGQHWEGPDQVQHDQVMPHLASLLTGLAGEAGHRIGDVLADRLTGDSADDSSHGHTASDVLADLIGNDAFVFNEVFGSPVFTDLLEKAGDFLDELAANVPPLQAALTELESGSGIIANILHELLPKDASPHALHQDNFVL
jgi:hypothetical protein